MNQMRELLPAITEDDRQLLHYNPNTDDLVEWAQDYAIKAVQAAQSVSVHVVGDAVENAAKSIAFMIDEWVHGCIKNGGNWQESLPTLIQLRLSRYWPTTSISAAELDALRKDAERWRKANEGGKFCIAEWAAISKEWADLLPETAIERIDAAIAQGKGE